MKSQKESATNTKMDQLSTLYRQHRLLSTLPKMPFSYVAKIRAFKRRKPEFKTEHKISIESQPEAQKELSI